MLSIFVKMISFGFSLAGASIEELGATGLQSVKSWLKAGGFVTDAEADLITGESEQDKANAIGGLIVGFTAALAFGPVIAAGFIGAAGLTGVGAIFAVAAVEFLTQFGVSTAVEKLQSLVPQLPQGITNQINKFGQNFNILAPSSLLGTGENLVATIMDPTTHLLTTTITNFSPTPSDTAPGGLDILLNSGQYFTFQKGSFSQIVNTGDAATSPQLTVFLLDGAGNKTGTLQVNTQTNVVQVLGADGSTINLGTLDLASANQQLQISLNSSGATQINVFNAVNGTSAGNLTIDNVNGVFNISNSLAGAHITLGSGTDNVTSTASGTVINTGTGTGDVLTVDNAQITFGGSDQDTVIGNNNAITLVNGSTVKLLSGTSSLNTGDMIKNFMPGDTIDLIGVGATSIPPVLGAGNLLTVHGSNGNVTLALDPNQNFTGANFIAKSDGNGGTNITETPGTTIGFSGYAPSVVNPNVSVAISGSFTYDANLADATVSTFGSPSDQFTSYNFRISDYTMNFPDRAAAEFSNLTGTLNVRVQVGTVVTNSLTVTLDSTHALQIDLLPYFFSNPSDYSAQSVPDSDYVYLSALDPSTFGSLISSGLANSFFQIADTWTGTFAGAWVGPLGRVNQILNQVNGPEITNFYSVDTLDPATMLVSGGGTVTMSSNITSETGVVLLAAAQGQTQSAYNFTANNTAGLTITDNSATNDTIFAGTGGDTINGGAGNDSLYGGTGNDTFNSGAGNNYLQGNGGNNTYNVTITATSQTTINNFHTDNGQSSVKLTNLASTDVRASVSGNDLVLSVGLDPVVIQNYFSGSAYQVNSINFADGVSWNYQNVLASLQAVWNGNSDDWSTASDWSNGVVPSANADALLGGTGGYSVTVSGDVAINNLDIENSGAVLFDNKSLTVNGQLNNAGAILLNGSLKVGGNATGAGTLIMRTGSFVEFGGANELPIVFGFDAGFVGGSIGTLKLDQPQQFTGRIEAFSAGDMIDLSQTVVSSAVINNQTHIMTVTNADGTTKNFTIRGADGKSVAILDDGASGSDLVVYSADQSVNPVYNASGQLSEIDWNNSDGRFEDVFYGSNGQPTGYMISHADRTLHALNTDITAIDASQYSTLDLGGNIALTLFELNVLSVTNNTGVNAVYTIFDTAANVSASLEILEFFAQVGQLSSINLTDEGTPTITLTLTQKSAYADALNSIVGSYGLHVTNVAATNAATVAVEAHVTSIAVSDVAVKVAANLDTLETLAVSGKLTSIALTNATKPTITLTEAQLSSDADALALIGSAYNLSVTNVAVADVASIAAAPNVTSIAVSDVAANVVANFDALEALAVSGKLTSILLTDATQPTITLTEAQLSSDAGVLALIGSAYNLSVTNVAAADAGTIAAEAHVTSIAVSDMAANVAANLDALEVLAKNGQLTSIALTDGGTPTLTITAAQQAADMDALNDIISPYNLAIISALTNKADTVLGGAVDNTIVAVAGTLNTTDNIDGGGGANTLALQGAGSFNLANPATLANIQVVTAQEGQAAYNSGGIASTRQTLTLRDGLNVTVNVASDTAIDSANPHKAGITINGANDSSTINLGSGDDTVFLGSSSETVNGGGGNNDFHVKASTIGATINGGSGDNSLYIAGGGAVTMGSNITGISTIHLQNATGGATQPDYVFTANNTANLVIDGSSGADTIIVGDASQTINMSGSNDRVILTAATVGALVHGGAGIDTIELTDGGNETLNVGDNGIEFVQMDQATNLFLNGQNGIGVKGSSGDDIITVTGGVLTAASNIDGGAGLNTMVLSGSGTFNLSAPASLTNIETINATEGQAGGSGIPSTRQTLNLRDGLNVTVNVASATVDPNNSHAPGITIHGANDSSIINLGNGQDIVYLGSSSETINGGNSSDFYVTAASAGALLNGGTSNGTLGNTLHVTGGGTAVLNAADVGISAIKLTDATDLTLNKMVGVAITGSSGNDTFTLNSSKFETVTGGGGYDTYRVDSNLISETITNSVGGGTTANGEIDFLTGLNDQDLWFQRSGNNLVIREMDATHGVLTVANWFGSNQSAKVSEITADGLKLDTQVTQLVNAMASYASSHSGFNPATATAMPTDATLQNAIAAAWHS